jgi:hypothetical protein
VHHRSELRERFGVHPLDGGQVPGQAEVSALGDGRGGF